MNFQRAILKCLLISLLFSFVAGGVYADGAGTTGATFLRIKAGPRAVAMGGAYTALSDDGFGMYWNPAGISRLEQNVLSATHQRQILDVDNEFISFGFPVGVNQTVGLSSRFLHTTDYYRTERDDGEEFTNYSGSMGLYYARGGRTGLAYGIGGKFIREKLASYKATSYAMDLGLHYKSPRTPLQLGLAVQHVGPEITFIEAGDPLPLTVRAGWAYEFYPLGRRWVVTNDIIYYQPENITSFALGTEYQLFNFLDLRAGYLTSQSYSTNSQFNLGLGLDYRAFTIDYSLADRENLEPLHVFSLSLAFGDRAQPRPYRKRPEVPAEERKKQQFKENLEKELQQLVPEEAPLQESMVEYWNQQATVHFQAEDYQQAVQLWKKCIEAGAERSEIYRQLGVAYFELGEKEKARRYLQQASQNK